MPKIPNSPVLPKKVPHLATKPQRDLDDFVRSGTKIRSGGDTQLLPSRAATFTNVTKFVR